jgi:hypothetical protein
MKGGMGRAGDCGGGYGCVSIQRFRLQPSLNSTSLKSDSPLVLYEQSLDRLAGGVASCVPGAFFPLHFLCPRADLTCLSLSCPSCPPPTTRHPSRKEPKPGELWLGSMSPR